MFVACWCVGVFARVCAFLRMRSCVFVYVSVCVLLACFRVGLFVFVCLCACAIVLVGSYASSSVCA